MSSYLDGAAFDNLYARRGCTAEDIAGLRKRVYARELTIQLGLHHLEEILLDPRARPELKVAKTKLMLSLGNFRRMTKPCESLLRDDLHAAMLGESSRLTIDANTQNVLSEGLGDLIETDGEELAEELVELLESARAERRRLLALIRGVATLAQRDDPSHTYVSQFRALALERLLGAVDANAENFPSSRAASFLGLAAGLSRLPDAGALECLPHALAALAAADELVTGDPVLIASQSLVLPLKLSTLAAFLSSSNQS